MSVFMTEDVSKIMYANTGHSLAYEVVIVGEIASERLSDRERLENHVRSTLPNFMRPW